MGGGKCVEQVGVCRPILRNSKDKSNSFCANFISVPFDIHLDGLSFITLHFWSTFTKVVGRSGVGTQSPGVAQ